MWSRAKMPRAQGCAPGRWLSTCPRLIIYACWSEGWREQEWGEGMGARRDLTCQKLKHSTLSRPERIHWETVRLSELQAIVSHQITWCLEGSALERAF